MVAQGKRWQHLAELGDPGARLLAARYQQALQEYCEVFGVPIQDCV